MTGGSGETATISVPDPARLRDYFLRLGADAAVEENRVRVQYVGDGSVDDTIGIHLSHWMERNNIVASILDDPPAAAPAPAPVSPTPVAPTPVERAPAPPAQLFLDRPRLGDLLQFKGLITPEQLQAALTESRQSGDLLGRVLIRRGFIFGDELARTLADQLDLPYVNLRVVGFEPSVAALLPSSIGMKFGVLPIGRVGGKVRVAFADPFDDQAKETVEAFVGDYATIVADLLEIELGWKSVDPSAALRVASAAD